MPPGPGDWTHQCFTYFWDQRAPHVVKHDIERRTGILLKRDPAQTFPLVYAGEKPRGMLHGRMELRLEAAVLNGVLYSLAFDAARGRDLFDEAKFLADSEKTFCFWLRDIHVTQDPGPIEFAPGERYERLVSAALEFEAKQAAVKEDESAIAAAQQAVLDALRAGKRYTLLDRVGVTYIQLEGDVLVKRRIGESISIETYTTDQEMLAFLRSYFDYDACKDTYPHKPPETEIWKYIGYQLK